MSDIAHLLIDHLDIWTGAVERRNGAGRGNGAKLSLCGIEKLRALILDLAVRGKLVSQNRADEPASLLLKRVKQAKNATERKARALVETEFAVPASLDLPSGWSWTRLVDIAEINPRNDAPDEQEASFVPMPLVSSRIDGAHEAETRRWGGIKSGYTHFADGDIALAKITPCFENGKAAMFQNLENGIGAGTTELHVARPYLEELNRRYLLIVLKTPHYLAKGEANMTGTAGQKRVPRSYFELTPFPLPPQEEQGRIVAKVDELMRLCDALEAGTLEAMEALKKLVRELLATLVNSQDAADLAANWTRIETHFDRLFTTEESIDALGLAVLDLAISGKLLRGDPHDRSAQDLAQQLRRKKKWGDTDDNRSNHPVVLPGIPSHWRWVEMGDVVLRSDAGWSPQCEAHPREGDEWGVLKVSAVSWGTFRHEENKKLPDSLEPRPDVEARPGDILISRANTADLVARSVIVPTDAPPRLMMSDKIVRLVIHSDVNAEFVHLCNLASWSRKYYARVAGGTSSSMKNVSRSQILALPIPLPPPTEQAAIVSNYHAATQLVGALTKAVNLADLHSSRIADALTMR